MSIATNNVIAKIAAVVAGLGLVAMSFAYAAPAAKADTASDNAALIASLMAQIEALKASMGGSASMGTAVQFNMDLTIGSKGADVTALQQWLVSKGFLQMPANTSYGYFGAVTKAAVAAWQASAGISPAAGYFGPISRAKANAAAGTTGGTTGGTTDTSSLKGGEGNLDNFDTLGDVESSVDEGEETVKILGVEFDANDADVMVERVDVEFYDKSVLSGSSSNLDNYIDGVSLWMDGKKVASLDVDAADEDNDVYSFRFTGLKGIVREDDTAELYVAVDAVSNLDGDDEGVTWSVRIPTDGIRAVDGAGISETYHSSALSETGISFDQMTAGDLDISEGDANPDSTVVQIDETNDTSGVLVLAFDVEADEQDITINDLPVGFVTSENEGVDGPAKRAILMADGKTIDTKSIPSSAGTSYEVTFDDLDFTVEDGETVEFTVELDLNDADLTTFASGTTLYATTTGSDWDAEDAEGDSVTVGGSLTNASNGVLTFRTDGIDVAWKSESAVTTVVDGSDNDYATFTMELTVSAFEEDAYILKNGANAITYQIENASTGVVLGTSTATTTVISSSADEDGSSYRIDAGQDETFTITVTVDPLAAGEGASYRFQLLTVIFGLTNSGTGQSWSATPASQYETNGTLISD